MTIAGGEDTGHVFCSNDVYFGKQWMEYDIISHDGLFCLIFRDSRNIARMNKEKDENDPKLEVFRNIRIVMEGPETITPRSCKILRTGAPVTTSQHPTLDQTLVQFKLQFLQERRDRNISDCKCNEAKVDFP